VKYLIILEPTDDGYSAYSPDLDGCVAAGDIQEETVGLMREAIQFHLDDLNEEGQPISESLSEPKYVEVG